MPNRTFPISDEMLPEKQWLEILYMKIYIVVSQDMK